MLSHHAIPSHHIVLAIPSHCIVLAIPSHCILSPLVCPSTRLHCLAGLQLTWARALAGLLRRAIGWLAVP